LRSQYEPIHDDLTTFRARLTGFGEVPPKLVDGQGRFTGTLSADGNSISWTVNWAGLTGPAQAAHIHFGQPQNVGSVVVFFCGVGGRPACPDGPGHSGTVTDASSRRVTRNGFSQPSESLPHTSVWDDTRTELADTAM